MIILALLFKPMVTKYIKENSIEIGQVWEYIPVDENPFKKKIFSSDSVIDVKGDYVLFIRNGDSISQRKSWFIIGYECVRNCD
tara:strand:- start:2889 stop:3137 length:249 start_codon:yes stop_codon:yes gene_type:complete